MENKNWPDEYQYDSQKQNDILIKIQTLFQQEVEKLKIPNDLSETLKNIYIPLVLWIVEKKQNNEPLVIGINGAQGSGKSTMCHFLSFILEKGLGFKVAGFSVDDIYKTSQERIDLSKTVHPLLATRGVPGTHDVQLGVDTIQSLKTATDSDQTKIPSFDKSIDDQKKKDQWPIIQGSVDIVIFEGWCVGVGSQNQDELTNPINQLEQDEDQKGAWRNYVNQKIDTEYQELFSLLDVLIMMKVPSMEMVFQWRSLQEEKLAESAKQKGIDIEKSHIMGEKELQLFIMHYERLTRHMLEEMPNRADLTMFLNDKHQINQIKIR